MLQHYVAFVCLLLTDWSLKIGVGGTNAWTRGNAFLTPGVSSTLLVDTYQHTGNYQNFVVPLGVTNIQVQLWGAGGGGSFRLNQYSYGGGSGGFSECFLDVTPGETLGLVVGGGGSIRSATSNFRTVASVAGQITTVFGGYGGGGNATQLSSDTPASPFTGTTLYGDFGSGGGRSAIQRNYVDIVAAGGGGGGGTAVGAVSSVSLWECHCYGGAGGGLAGVPPSAANLKSCHTTATAANQTSGGVSACGRGARLLGGQSMQTRGSGGGGGYYGGAPGCPVTATSPMTKIMRTFVTGGTGGSGYLGGCRKANPAFSVAGSAGNVYTSSAAPQASERAYMPGVGVGGRSVAGPANPTGNGGNGLIYIRTFHTVPTASPTPAPFTGVTVVLAPTPLPTIDTSTVYKFPRVRIASDITGSTGAISVTNWQWTFSNYYTSCDVACNTAFATACMWGGFEAVMTSASFMLAKAMATPPISCIPFLTSSSESFPGIFNGFCYVSSAVPLCSSSTISSNINRLCPCDKSGVPSPAPTPAPLLPGARGPIRASSRRSRNTNSAALLFDGITAAPSLAFQDNVCNASAASALNCNDPYAAAASIAYMPCLYKSTYRYNAAGSAKQAKYQADPVYLHSAVTYANMTLTARFPSAAVGCLASSNAVSGASNVCFGASSGAQSNSNAYDSRGKAATYSTSNSDNRLSDPMSAALGVLGEDIPYGDYITLNVKEMVTPSRFVLLAKHLQGTYGKPRRFKIFGSTAALAPWVLVLDQTAQPAAYLPDSAGNQVYTSAPLTAKAAFSQFALVVTEVDAGCSNFQLLAWEIYGVSMGLEDVNKAWVQSDYLGEYAKVDLGEPMLLRYHKLYVDAPGTGRPAKFRVYGSLDATNWDLVVDQSAAAIAYPTSSNVYTSPAMAAKKAYRHYAIAVGAVEAGAQCLKLLEWELYGTLPPPLATLPLHSNTSVALSAAAAMANTVSYATFEYFDNAACSGPVVHKTAIAMNQCLADYDYAETTMSVTFSTPTVLLVSSTVGLNVGQKVIGTGILTGTTVVALTATTINLSQATAATGSVTLTFKNVIASPVSWSKPYFLSLSATHSVMQRNIYSDPLCVSLQASGSTDTFPSASCIPGSFNPLNTFATDPVLGFKISAVSKAMPVFSGPGYLWEGYSSAAACASAYTQPSYRKWFPSNVCYNSGRITTVTMAGSTISGSAVITVASTTGIHVGSKVTSDGICISGTTYKVVALTSTTVTLNDSPTISASCSFSFTPMNAITLTVAASTSNSTVTAALTTGVTVGSDVYGTCLPSSTTYTVLAVTAMTVTLSIFPVATGTCTLTFVTYPVLPVYAMKRSCVANTQGGAVPGHYYFKDSDCKVPFEARLFDLSMGAPPGPGLCSEISNFVGHEDSRFWSYTCSSASAPSSSSAFGYSGQDDSFVVPPGVTQLTVKLWGAGGGTYANAVPNSNNPPKYSGSGSNWSGGAGGFVQCTLAVTPGERLGVVVGGGGGSLPLSSGTGSYTAGGFGGGGDGLSTNANGWSCGGGGGRSAIQRNGEDLVVSGGGGGACEGIRGGGGGGLVGGTPNLPDCGMPASTVQQNPVPDCAYLVGDGQRSRMLGPGQADAGKVCEGVYGSSQTWYTGQLGGRRQGGPLAGGATPWTADRSAQGWGGGGGGGYFGGASGCVGGGAGGSGYTGGCIQSLPIVNLQGSVGAALGQLDVSSALPPNIFDADYPGDAVGVAPQTVHGMNAAPDAFPARAGHGFVVFTPATASPVLQKFPRVTNVAWSTPTTQSASAQYFSTWPRTPQSDASRALPLSITASSKTWYTPGVFDGRVSSGEIRMNVGYKDGVFTGAPQSLAGDGYMGNFFSIDMGEEVLPAYFRVWCDAARGNQCPGLFRLYGGTKQTASAASGNSGAYTNTPTMQPAASVTYNWDLLYDQAAPATFDVCTFGSDATYDSALNAGTGTNFASGQSNCFTSGAVQAAQSYRKFAWVWRAAAGTVDVSSVYLSEVELFGALQPNAWSPTTQPTTAVGTPQPSPKPSLPIVSPAAPTNMLRVQGSGAVYYHRTYHAGKKCLSAPVAFTVEPVPLNTCMPKDASNPAPYMFTCKLGAGSYTLSRTLFADAACMIQQSAPTIYVHDFTCKKDVDSAYSLLTGCGPLAPAISEADLVAVQSFSNAACTAGLKVRSTLLGVCEPVYQSPKGHVSHHQTVTFSTSNDSSLTLTVRLYSSTLDKKCAGAFSSKTVTYLLRPAACAPDPLYPGLFYRNAMRAQSFATDVVPYAQSWTAFVARPSPAPTPRPTAPTPLPSLAPTPLPSAAPTPLPSAAPSPVITGAGGYSIKEYYGDSQCATSAYYTETRKLEVCMIAGMGGYFLTNKVDGNLITTTYTDSACTVYAPPTAAPTPGASEAGGGMMGSFIPAPSVALNSGCVSTSFGHYTKVSWAQTVITTPATTTAGTTTYFIWPSSSDCTAQESNWISSTSSTITTVSDGQYCRQQGPSSSLLATCPTGGATAGYNTVAYNTDNCSGSPAGELTSTGACSAYIGEQYLSQTLGGCSAAPAPVPTPLPS